MNIDNKLPAYREVQPGRYREDNGLLYEDFVIDDVIEHRPGRTITTTDNIWSSLLCLNQHPLHIDDVRRRPNSANCWYPAWSRSESSTE